MQTVTLQLSPVELRAMRAAMADYACLAYRRALELKNSGAASCLSDAQTAHELAACRVLGRLPAIKA